MYFSNFDQFIPQLKSKGISVGILGRNFYFAFIDSSIEVDEKQLQSKYSGKARVMTQLKKEKNIKIVVVNKEGINSQDLDQDF